MSLNLLSSLDMNTRNGVSEQRLLCNVPVISARQEILRNYGAAYNIMG